MTCHLFTFFSRFWCVRRIYACSGFPIFLCFHPHYYSSCLITNTFRPPCIAQGL